MKPSATGDCKEEIDRKVISSGWAQSAISPFDEISRLCARHQAVNLALGAPDLSTPEEVIEAAVQALRNGLNQYSNSWGDKTFREAIAQKVFRHRHVEVDPEREITVTCGTTEAMLNVMLTISGSDDEIILFEPFYSSYIPAVRINGASVRYVALHRPDWMLDEDQLRAAFNSRTKAIIINSPSNPTGKVFTEAELRLIADLCCRWNVLCITDEVYEHLVFDGRTHCSMLELADMRERTVVLSGLSKTYNLTGWRLAYIIAPPGLTDIFRRAHGYVTYCAPTPLQVAGIKALQLPDSYYQSFCQDMQLRRDSVMNTLRSVGFICYKPAGAFYLMANISSFGHDDDISFCRFLIKEIGVGVMPGSGFYADRVGGRDLVRFCFGKSDATLAAAEERLSRLINA